MSSKDSIPKPDPAADGSPEPELWRVRIIATEPVALEMFTAAPGAVLVLPEGTAKALCADRKADRVY